MSGNTNKRLEIAANLATVIVLAAIVGVLAYKYFSAAPDKAPDFVEVAIGETLEVPDIDWVRNKQTLVVAISSDCTFCVESAPFYRKLAEKISATNDTKLVAIFPHTVEQGRMFLKEHSVAIEHQMEVDLASARILGTPNIYLVDERGVVRYLWIGKLSPEKETEVLEKI